METTAVLSSERNRLAICHFFVFMGLLCSIFYSFKGFPSVLVYLATGIPSFSRFFIPFLVGTLIVSLAVVFFTYRGIARKMDLTLFLIGLGFLAWSLHMGEPLYTRVVILCFLLPLVYFPLGQVSDKSLRLLLRLFFSFVAIYLVVEFVLLHTHLLGLTEKVWITTEDLVRYYSLLGYEALNRDLLQGGNLLDFRQEAQSLYGQIGRVRTGGFLADSLQMPSLISMTATFFYVCFRHRGSLRNLFWCLLALFSLINSLSATAIGAFFLCALFYEFYFGRPWRRFLIIAFILAMLTVLIFLPTPLSSIVRRQVISFKELDYLSKFTIPLELLRELNWGRLAWIFLFGSGSWLETGLYAENDITNLIVSFGAILAYLIFRQWLHPLSWAKRRRDPSLILYSMIVLNAFFCLIHREAVLAPNIFLVMIVLNTRSHWLICRYRWSSG